MARGGSIALVAMLASALIAVAGCGKKQENPRTVPVTGPGAPKGAPTPREAINLFFEAKRTGNTELGCSLESEDFQIAQDKGTGQACLKSSINQHPQPVWAKKIKI